MDNRIDILLLEDSEFDAALLIRHLQSEGIDFNCSVAKNKEAFLKGLHEYKPDLIIADYSLPQFSGMEAFRIMREEVGNIPFILVTGTISEKTIIEFAREGIDDYILKDNLLRLGISIDNVVNKKRIEKLHKQLKAAHKDMRDSITYARIIQEALLPDPSILNQIFPNSFILFKPKDILSGDFYWFKKKESTFFIAAADCTGHGVPGALLSMMGMNLLDEAATKALPSRILRTVNNQMKRILNHKSTPINDGMDIVLCSISPNYKELNFAGANRPLYLIREHQLHEFKPDRAPIGGIENNNQFTDQIIPLQEGDRIYLFSDGFADQFHFETDKKMTSRRFQEMLIASSFMEFQTQRNYICDFFDLWKGYREQVDDVLVIGIEIP